MEYFIRCKVGRKEERNQLHFSWYLQKGKAEEKEKIYQPTFIEGW